MPAVHPGSVCLLGWINLSNRHFSLYVAVASSEPAFGPPHLPPDSPLPFAGPPAAVPNSCRSLLCAMLPLVGSTHNLCFHSVTLSDIQAAGLGPCLAQLIPWGYGGGSTHSPGAPRDVNAWLRTTPTSSPRLRPWDLEGEFGKAWT